MEGETNDEPSSDEPAEVKPPASESETVHSAQGNSFAKFLYNQNPFYLISCLLVIYGCQSLALTGGSLIEKSLSMTGGIAAYAVLMGLICIAVVRLAKVWDDARSIFIVVIISLVAVTTGFDELCIGDQQAALIFGVLSAILVLFVIESVSRACKIRLALPYRASMYGQFGVMIVLPLLLGRAVANRNDGLANWGSVLFSVAIAGCMLLLIPAVRRGQRSIKASGTPWRWPLYPLSAFVVLLVLAAIRSHAIWMSFGFYGTAGKFEPFLLLPMLAALVILISEAGVGLRSKPLQWTALAGVPTLMLCGLSHDGATWLPIRSDLQFCCGSALTASMAIGFAVYLWMTLRGVQYAVFGLPATLMVIALAAPLPEIGQMIGLQSWMFPAVACAILLWMTIRMKHPDWLWAALATTASVMIAMLGQSYGHPTDGVIAASVFSTSAMLVIGAVYQTNLAVCLRYLAAGGMSLAVATILLRSLPLHGGNLIYAALGIAVVSMVYGFIVRRRGWLLTATLHSILFFACVGYHGHRSGDLRRINWPIASGLMCLCVGIAITTGKTGVYRRIANRKPTRKIDAFQSGF